LKRKLTKATIKKSNKVYKNSHQKRSVKILVFFSSCINKYSKTKIQIYKKECFDDFIIGE